MKHGVNFSDDGGRPCDANFTIRFTKIDRHDDIWHLPSPVTKVLMHKL